MPIFSICLCKYISNSRTCTNALVHRYSLFTLTHAYVNTHYLPINLSHIQLQTLTLTHAHLYTHSLKLSNIHSYRCTYSLSHTCTVIHIQC